jgi:hypothetical protein
MSDKPQAQHQLMARMSSKTSAGSAPMNAPASGMQ